MLPCFHCLVRPQVTEKIASRHSPPPTPLPANSNYATSIDCKTISVLLSSVIVVELVQWDRRQMYSKLNKSCSSRNSQFGIRERPIYGYLPWDLVCAVMAPSTECRGGHLNQRRWKWWSTWWSIHLWVLCFITRPISGYDINLFGHNQNKTLFK